MARKRKFTDGMFDVEPIMDALKIRSGQTVIDAGCGNGYMSEKFAESVGKKGKVYALDIDEHFIESVKKEMENTNIIPLVSDITTKTELEDASVDVVYLSMVFHIFSKTQVKGFEKEVKRISKKNAKIGILNLKKNEMPFGPSVEVKSSPEELKQKLSFSPKELVDIDEFFYLQLFENV